MAAMGSPDSPVAGGQHSHNFLDHTWLSQQQFPSLVSGMGSWGALSLVRRFLNAVYSLSHKILLRDSLLRTQHRARHYVKRMS